MLYPPARGQTVSEVLKTGSLIFRLSLKAALPYGLLVAVCSELANLRNLSVDLPVQSFDSTDPSWWAWYLAGFLLFRLFDIAKPFGIRALQRVGGGFGIVVDDLLAAVYAAGCLHALHWGVGLLR